MNDQSAREREHTAHAQRSQRRPRRTSKTSSRTTLQELVSCNIIPDVYIFRRTAAFYIVSIADMKALLGSSFYKFGGMNLDILIKKAHKGEASSCFLILFVYVIYVV
jgi:hypothetical protein